MVNYDAVGTQQFQLNCPFVPDIVVTQAIIGGVSNGNVALAPIRQAAAGLTGFNVFSIQTNCFPATNAPIIAPAFNNINPPLTYVNTSRSTFQGSFSIDTVNTSGNLPMQSGQVILIFEFVQIYDSPLEEHEEKKRKL